MKQTKQYGELIFLSAVVIYVIYYFLTIHSYARQAVLWPFVLMAGTIICVVNVILEIYRENKNKEKSEESFDFSSIKSKAPILFIIFSFTLYALLLKKLGLHLANFLLCFAIVFYLRHNYKIAGIIAAVITVFFYLVFDLTLGINFPKFDLL